MRAYAPAVDIYVHQAGIALFTAALLAYPIFRMLLALRSRQTVSQYAPEGHQKKQGTPTMGGLIIVTGALAGMLYAFVAIPRAIPHFSVAALATGPALLIGFTVIGFVDDFLIPRLRKGSRGLAWKPKILMQFGVAGLAVSLGHPSFDLVWLAAVVLVLFFSNAYNFADGLDWLAGMLLLAFGLGLIGIAWWGRAFDVIAFVAPLLGASLPFLVLNRPPARIFMGDAGSLPIGAVLGFAVAVIAMPSLAPHLYTWGYGEHQGELLFSLPSAQNPGVVVALLILSLVLVAELVPLPRQSASVQLRKHKLSSYTPSHHAFEKSGWPEGRVVAAFVAGQIAFSVAAVAIAGEAVRRQEDLAKRDAVEHLRQQGGGRRGR